MEEACPLGCSSRVRHGEEDGYRYTYVGDSDRSVLELVAPTERTERLKTELLSAT